jgi:HK97 family phage major capsid protein
MSIMEFRTATAVKKHAGLKLRKAGITDPDGFEPHRLEWRDLNAAERAVAEISREVLDQMSGAADETLASLTAAHDGLMSLYDLIAAEKDGRTNSGSREPRSQSLTAARRPIPKDATCYGDGTRSYSNADGGEVQAFAIKPEQRMTDWARQNGAQDSDGLTTGGLLRAMLVGAKTDAERRALSEGSNGAGGYTVPDILSASMIDRLRSQSVLTRAGARTVPLASDNNFIARVASDPTTYWRAENAEVTASDPTFDRITLAPKSLMCLVKCSRELLEDSLNMEQMLPQIIAAAMAQAVDLAGLFGTGADGQPTGLTGLGIGQVALNAKLSAHAGGAYGSLVAARAAILTANAAEPTAILMNPREDGALVGLRDGNGMPAQAPAKIAAVPQLMTTAIATTGGVGTNESSIIMGDFKHLLIGLRNSLRIEILKERYAEHNQYGFIAHLRVDFAAEHLGAFAEITGIRPEA